MGSMGEIDVYNLLDSSIGLLLLLWNIEKFYFVRKLGYLLDILRSIGVLVPSGHPRFSDNGGAVHAIGEDVLVQAQIFPHQRQRSQTSKG